MSLRYSVYQELAVSFLECLQSMHQERRGEEEKKEKEKKSLLRIHDGYNLQG